MTFPNLNYEIDLWEKGFIVIGIDEVGRGAFAGPLFAAGVIFAPPFDSLSLAQGKLTNEKRFAELLSHGINDSNPFDSLRSLRARKHIKHLESLGINDSKKLTADKREMLDKVIRKEAFAFHISSISVAEINRIGVGRANFKAMREVVKKLQLSVFSGQLSVDSLSVFGQSVSGLTNRKLTNKILKTENGELITEKTNPRLFVLVDGSNVKKFKGAQQKSIIHGDGISLSIAAASIIAKVARDDYMRNLSEEYSEFGWDQNKGYGTLLHREALAKFGSTPFHRTDFVEGFI